MNPQLLQLLTEKDPKMAQLLMLMQQQDESTTTNSPELSARRVRGKERRRRKKLELQLRSMQEEIGIQETLLNELAAGLGACPSCWGSDERCPDCAGEGKPGTYKPDPRMYRAYVVPALKRAARQPKTNQEKPITDQLVVLES